MSHDEDVVTMLALTNALRKRWKRKPLEIDENLSLLAAERSDNMASAGNLFHGKGPAENVGFGFDSPEDAVRGWVNSPEHRDNIVNREHTHIGSGVSMGAGVSWWCILFATRSTD